MDYKSKIILWTAFWAQFTELWWFHRPISHDLRSHRLPSKVDTFKFMMSSSLSSLLRPDGVSEVHWLMRQSQAPNDIFSKIQCLRTSRDTVFLSYFRVLLLARASKGIVRVKCHFLEVLEYILRETFLAFSSINTRFLLTEMYGNL